MTWTQAVSDIIVLFLIIVAFLAAFTDFFQTIFNRTAEVEVVPNDLVNELRSVTDEMREIVDEDVVSLRKKIVEWARRIDDAVEEQEDDD